MNTQYPCPGGSENWTPSRKDAFPPSLEWPSGCWGQCQQQSHGHSPETLKELIQGFKAMSKFKQPLLSKCTDLPAPGQPLGHWLKALSMGRGQTAGAPCLPEADLVPRRLMDCPRPSLNPVTFIHREAWVHSTHQKVDSVEIRFLEQAAAAARASVTSGHPCPGAGLLLLHLVQVEDGWVQWYSLLLQEGGEQTGSM